MNNILKDNIILYGAGFYGRNAYMRLKEEKHIINWVDSNEKLHGKLINGIEIIGIEDLIKKNLENVSIVICSKAYFEISMQLGKYGIKDYFVFIEGFLFHSDQNETMMPVELEVHLPIKKVDNKRSILFVQNAACIRTHKIAFTLKEQGYDVYLLYTLCPPEDGNSDFTGIYKRIFGFTSANAIQNFIAKSEFDVIHCSNAPDLLASIALGTTKPIVFDTHDMNSLWGFDSIEELTLEFIANKYSDGNIYTSQAVVDIARKKFDLENKEVMCLENVVLRQVDLKYTLDKLSLLDRQIHCVYEGGINFDDPNSDRYYIELWKRLTDEGIHIHFYSQTNPKKCIEYEKESKYLHYEGNLGSMDLIKEMTKYDCGLALFNVNDKNRLFIETATANKIYEYLNSRLPVIVGGLKNYTNFVLENNVGIGLDYTRAIRPQIEEACTSIVVDENFLEKNGLTMISKGKELVDFYERVIRRKKEKSSY